MASDGKLHMPGSFGGLTRYNEEYKSRFTISPEQVVIFLILVLIFVLAMKLFSPVAA